MDKNIRLATYVARCIENEILMFLRTSKKVKAEVYLNEPIGKDKDDNEISLIDILENDEKNIEDEIDLKIKTKKLYERMKDILKGREKTIIELRFGLRRNKTKDTKSNCRNDGNIEKLCIKNREKGNRKIKQQLGERIVNRCLCVQKFARSKNLQFMWINLNVFQRFETLQIFAPSEFLHTRKFQFIFLK